MSFDDQAHCKIYSALHQHKSTVTPQNRGGGGGGGGGGGPLTTRQPAEYSWMSGYPTPLTKIGQSLLCTGSSTQGTTYPNNQQ